MHDSLPVTVRMFNGPWELCVPTGNSDEPHPIDALAFAEPPPRRRYGSNISEINFVGQRRPRVAGASGGAVCELGRGSARVLLVVARDI